MSTVWEENQPQTSKPLASWLRQSLRCPVTGEPLVEAIGPDGGPILISRGARLAYPVREGVPVLLVHEATELANPEEN